MKYKTKKRIIDKNEKMEMKIKGERRFVPTGLRDGVRRVHDPGPGDPEILWWRRAGAGSDQQRDRDPGRVHHVSLRHVPSSYAAALAPRLSIRSASTW